MIEKKVERSFWGHPKILVLNSGHKADGDPSNSFRISTSDGKDFALPDDDSFISDMILKMRNLQEVYLQVSLDAQRLRRVLFVLLESSIFYLWKN